MKPSALDRIHILAPSGATLDGEAARLARQHASMPFSTDRVALLDQYSHCILRHSTLRRDPSAVALAFWLRKANVMSMESEFVSRPRAVGTAVPAGLVFHIAPANVDTMFLLSWAVGFLGGNSNIVRLTSTPSILTIQLLQLLDSVLRSSPASAAGNWFVSYEHDDAITEAISNCCDTRIVWGGDETIRRIRNVPMNPHGTERVFASKRSISVIDCSAYRAASCAQRDDLAKRMAGDLAPFGQMGCSSPHVVFWLDEDRAEYRQDFIERVEIAMEQKVGSAEISAAARRISHAFVAAAEGRAAQVHHAPYTTTITTSQPALAEPQELCGAGYLTHCGIGDLRELGTLLGPKHQTITYFGLSAESLDELGRNAGAAGVDRIVAIGNALDFEPFWDGYDLWSDVTRLVRIS